MIFSKLNQERQWSKNALSAVYTENKIRVAALQFHSIVGSLPSGISQLKDSGFVLSEDVSNYLFRVHNGLEKNQDSLEKKWPP